MEEPSPRRESPKRGDLERQGSSLGKYFNPKRIPKLSSCSESITEEGVEKEESGGLTDIDDGIECDDDIYIDGQAPAFIHHTVDSIHHSRSIPQSPWKQRMGKPADAADSDLDSVDGSSTELAKYSGSSIVPSEELSKFGSTNPPEYNGSSVMPPLELSKLSPAELAKYSGRAIVPSKGVSKFSSTDPPERSGSSMELSKLSSEELAEYGGSAVVLSKNLSKFSSTNPPEYGGSSIAPPRELSKLSSAELARYRGSAIVPSKELSKFSSSNPPEYSGSSIAPPMELSNLSSAELAKYSGTSMVPSKELSKISSTEPPKYDERSTGPPKLDQLAYATAAVTSFARPAQSGSTSYSPNSQRVQPVGADELTDSGIQTGTESTPLQRVFKVVFVGDSGVGKSSFIYRFCKNHFKASYAATIGVDFQIKNLPIENQIIVLQLWDTAGQERFRSITKQYFRKADGVVVMYDVTSETSFTNVRNWMTSVQDGVSDDAILVLLGNKNDLPEDDDTKAVKMKDGSRLADEYGMLYYETSAFSGENVNSAMEALARVLREKEDKEIEKSFHLEDAPKKKGCCS